MRPDVALSFDRMAAAARREGLQLSIHSAFRSDAEQARLFAAKPMRPDVAAAFDRMATAARREASLYLSVSSGFRSDAEQAVLWNAKPNPH